MGSYIAMGVVFGVVGVAVFIGGIKFINWCLGVSEKIDQLGVELDLGAQQSDRKCVDLGDAIKRSEVRMSERYVKHSEAILDGFIALNKRVDELEEADQGTKEKTDDN